MNIVEGKDGAAPWFDLQGALARPGPQMFFALAALYGAAVLLVWIAVYRLHLAEPVPPVMWHAHEMVYGFAAAVAAGFVCGVVPAWSYAPALSGRRIGALVAVWLIGRIVMAANYALPPWLAAVADLAFIPALAAVVVVPAMRDRALRNLALLAWLAVVWLGDLAMHADAFGFAGDIAERGARVGVDAYLLLIAIVGGAAIPALTNRAFHDAGSRATALTLPWLDGLAVASIAVYLVCDGFGWVGVPIAAAALAAALLNGARLVLWRGYRFPHAPDIWILHCLYLWMVLGLLIEAGTPIFGAVADMAAIHVLTAGAIGTASIALISWAHYARSGHAGFADRFTVAAYGLVTLAAVLRVAALLVPGGFARLVIASGIVWVLAFVALLIACLSGLAVPRRSVS